MSALNLEEVTVAYGKQPPVIDRLSLDVPSGEFHAMVGPSGSGKTSILKAIGGFVFPSAGQVRLGERDVTRAKPARRRLGIVFQDYALFPHMTVRQNVEFGLRVARVERVERRTRVQESLELVSLGALGHRYPDELSGGQQQRVALARALVTSPEALLLDEPLSALDRKIRLEMQLELRRIQRETGITALIVTHDQQEALSLGDQLVVLNGGKIQQAGSPQDVYDHPSNHFVASFLGNINSFTGRLGDNGRDVVVSNTVFGASEAPGDVAPGGEVTVCVRPERVSLRKEHAQETRPHCSGVSFPGTVASLMLNGQTIDCEVRTELGPVLVSLLSSNAQGIAANDQVYLEAKAEDLRVYTADQTAAKEGKYDRAS